MIKLSVSARRSVCAGSCAALVLGAFFAAQAATYTIGDDPGRYLVSNGETFVAQTIPLGSGELPDGTPTPTFWLDASDRTDWEFADEDKTQVTKIPSKVGARYLTTTTTGGDWGNWKLKSPVVATDLGELRGGAYLDFGGYGSDRGLVFNPIGGHTALTNVATVITVFGSHAGGGSILGGGYTPGKGYAFARNNNGTHEAKDLIGYDGALFDSSAQAIYKNGIFRQNGNLTSTTSFTLTGDWEILSLAATSTAGEATGLGLNDARTQSRNGGMRIAEMLIFDEILTQAQMAKVEAYLEKKWMGNGTPGVGGDAHVSMVRVARTADGSSDARDSNRPYPTTLNVEAPAGETLTIDKLYGGSYGGSQLVKTGAGALAFGSAEEYGGTVTLKGGTLDLTRKQTPAAMPSNWVFQLDASAANAVTVESRSGTNDWVTFWKNECDVSFKGTHPEGAFHYSNRETHKNCVQPRFVENALGTGKHAVDFGQRINNWTSSDYKEGRSGNLRIAQAGATEGTYKTYDIPRISTVVAVIAPHGGGGTIVTDGNGSNSRFSRGSGSLQINTPLTPNTASVCGCTVTNRVFQDAARTDGMTEGNRTYGWQVVVEQFAQEAIRNIGTHNDDWYSGGFRMAELVLYDRILSDAEIKDVTAYLTKKWFAHEAAGYEKLTDAADVPSLQAVTVEAPATIHVARGTVRLRKLTVNAPLVKTGAGTLEVEEIEDASQITVAEGALTPVAKHDPKTDSELAPGAALHLDANERGTMYVARMNGNDNVTVWHDVNGRNCAGNFRADNNFLQTDGGGILCENVEELGGKSVIKFPAGRGMRLSQSLDNVRSAFVILGSQEGGGNVFGGARFAIDGDNCYHYDFRRGGSTQYGATAGDPILYGFAQNEPLLASYGGSVLTNGVAVNPLTVGYSGGYQLIEFHAAVGMHVSSLACAAIGWQDTMIGRCRIGEVVVYERELTDREKAATRNYLMAKWFGATPTALPGEAPVAPTYTNANVVVVGGATNEFAVAEGTVARGEIAGTGALVKTGAGTLTVKDVSRFAGAVEVTEGTLQVTGVPAAIEPALPLAGRLAHFDASDDASSEISGTSGRRVPALTLANLAEGSDVVAQMNGMTADATCQTQNGKRYVSIPKSSAYYNFRDANGDFTGLTNICSVLWVIGSKNGGGTLLGGYINEAAGYPSTPYSYAWERDFDDYTQPLMGPSSLYNYSANCNWYLNGASVNPGTQGLSGAFDQISLVLKEGQTFKMVAGGLAMCGYGGLVYGAGAQDIGEIVLYDRRLTDDERLGAEAYLNAKWGLNNGQWGVTNAVDLILGADGAFDCGGVTQYVASVSGGGAIGNGALKTPKIVLDLTNPETLTAETLVFADGFTVEVANAATSDLRGTYKLATVTEDFAGTFEKTAVTFPGVANPPRGRIRCRGNDLVLTIGSSGVVILLR